MPVTKSKDLREEREAQRAIRLRTAFSMGVMLRHMKHGDPKKGRKKMMSDNKDNFIF